MKTILFPSIFLFSALTLTACGENFSAANVSLGGSGSGTLKPLPGGNNGGISNPSTGDKDERYEYLIAIPKESQSSCKGIQRTMGFIDAKTKQPFPVNSLQPLAMAPLQIEISNTTSDYVYQRVPLCRPIEFQVGETIMFHGQSLRCATDQDEIQVLRPYETRRYELDLSFAETELPLIVNYNAFYATDLPSIDLAWEKCEAAQITVPIYKKSLPKKSESIAQPHPDTEIAVGEKNKASE
ncbi:MULTISPECIES: hypothetical protein [Acinetobacter]|uniref:hypothetical protein n=1 Tax=Acinetobacter TaxID=469 RepID=UPI0002CEA65B|nr:MULTISPECIES: hypothetical protein [Acinetobacter]ENX10549.1 hypothetical protein F898_00279 [Acinetobacter courvalinii]